MELRYFLSVLSKRKWLLIFAALVAAITTAYLAGLMPKKYKSGAILSTGITDYKGVRVGEQNVFVQEFEIENKFANLAETMKSRMVINGLSKILILNDLLTGSGKVAFSKLPPLDKIKLTQKQVDDYVQALANRPDSMGPETNVELLNTATIIQKALGYDYETLRDKLDIKRIEKSDYLKVECTAPRADLAYFTAKTYLDEFLSVFYLGKDTNQNNSVIFYNKLTNEKKRSLDSLNNLRYNYAKNHGVVALVDQSQAIVAQIKDAETIRNEEEKKYKFYGETAAKYKDKQRPYSDQVERTYKTNIFNNEEIVSLGNQINALQIQWTNSDFKDENISKQIEALKTKRAQIIREGVIDKRDDQDPVVTKNNEVFLRFIDAESNRDGSKQTIDVVNNRITELEGRKSKLINDNAEFGKLTQQIDIAQKEYENVFDKKNQADVIKQSGSKELPMKVVENPMYPNAPEASKRTLLATFAGVSTGTLGILLLFGLAYFDRSLNSRFQYAKHIGLPLLGVLNKLNSKKQNDFTQLFETEKSEKEVEYFKEALRKLRHEIEISDSRSFLFVSLKQGEGKSFLIAALAHTLAMKNKKVLIIDTNFKHNTLSQLSPNPFLKTGEEISTELVPVDNGKAKKMDFDFKLAKVDIIGNKMSSHSPSELLSGVDFKRQINDFSKTYDYVFMEAACLSKFSDARELVDYVDKVVPVFDASTSLSKDDEYNIQYLHDLNGKVLGSILNKANLKNLD